MLSRLVGAGRHAAVAFAMLALVGCGSQSSSNGSPKPATNPTPTPTPVPLSTGTSSLGIGLTNPSQSLTYPTGIPISVSFTLSGDQGKTVYVGVAQGPTGATITQTGSNVTLNWSAPVVGSYNLQFILRDAALCAQVEGNAANCAFAPTATGTMVAKSYDVSSNYFPITVQSNTLSPTTPSTLAPTTGNQGLINQITGLVGGGSGLQGLLSGLSTGQLTQLLGQVQGGMGLSQLLQLLQGIH